MSIKQRIVVYFGLVFLLAVVLIIWGVLAFHGLADREQYVTQLASIATLIVAALSALGGFHSGRAGAGSEFVTNIAAPAPVATMAAPVSLAATVQPDTVQSIAASA